MVIPLKEADLLITNIGQLLTMESGGGQSFGPKRGRDARDLGLISHAVLACRNGRVIAAGPAEEVEAAVSVDAANVLDAGGRVVAPGFVDAHTHVVFAGWRAFEYGMRSEGRSYLDIAAAGGGIRSTVRATREASFEELCTRALGFLDQMLLYGTTSCEAKSGYGLDLETELKQLRVARYCDERHPVDLVSTFLGAHAFPPESDSPNGDARETQVTKNGTPETQTETQPETQGAVRQTPGIGHRERYIRQVIEMLPIVRDLGLARFVDVFCDEGAFTIDETRRILLAAKELGFDLKVHADEIKWTGATELACELGAVSCDHLIKVSERGIRALAESDTIAVLLPATSVFLGECPGAPGRALIDAGAAVALGTDFNPGTSTAMSMPLCMTLACSTLRLTPEEAFTAATWNAAWASGLGGKAGGLSPGFQADAVVFQAGDYREIAYRFGTSLVDTVVKGGKIVVSNGGIVKGP